MIRIIFASVFLFAISAQVSGEQINCYACYDGTIPTSTSGKQIQFKNLRNPPVIPKIEKCSETMENQTIPANTEIESCLKIDLSATITDASTNKDTDIELTLRYVILKDKCGPVENLIVDAGDFADLDISASCYECDDDLCNSATSIQISFLTFLVLIVSMFAVRN